MKGAVHAYQIIMTLYIFKKFQSLANINSNRIISGNTWFDDDNQFMVAVAFHTTKCEIKSDTMAEACHFSCTGSIISSHWVISASHCLGPKKRIDAMPKRRRNPCLSKLNGKPHLLKGILCAKNRHGDLIIYPKKVKSYIFVKVTNFETEYNTLTHYEIDKVIIPREAYRGGGYKVL